MPAGGRVAREGNGARIVDRRIVTDVRDGFAGDHVAGFCDPAGLSENTCARIEESVESARAGISGADNRASESENGR